MITCYYYPILLIEYIYKYIKYSLMVESAWAEDMGQFLYRLDTNTRKINKRLKKLQLKIIN